MEGEWFDDVPVVGRMSPAAAAEKLREVGEFTPAADGPGDEEDPRQSLGESWGWFRPRKWEHTGHAFGFIASPPQPGEAVPIRNASVITPDLSLNGARIKITLDRLRIAEYPGGGVHHVLFDFYARNQLAGEAEHLHFNATFRGRQGESAAVVGFPIFVGLLVGDEGVSFKCFTVNVKNEQDSAMLGFLDSDIFKAGLRLAASAQPALAPLATMACGLTKALANRNKNVPVQDFYLGLDFSGVAARARLAEGSYIAVQIPEDESPVWDWGQWSFHLGSGQVVATSDHKRALDYNYVVFSVSRLNESGNLT